MKFRYVLPAFFVILVGSFVYGLTLDLIPNEASTAKVKEVFNKDMSAITNAWVTNLGPNVIDGTMIVTNAISNHHVAASSITSDKIVDGTVSNANLGLNVISSDRIINGAVSNGDMAVSSIASATIIDGTVSNADLGLSIISSDRIIDGTVSNVDLASGIDGAKITTGNVPLAAITNALVTPGATWTNAQTGFTNIFSASGILISHTP